MPSSFMERSLGAARLDAATYEEVEHDQEATVQAAGVVALAAVASAIGAAGGGGASMIGSLIAAFIGWAAWSGVTLFIGTRVFGGRSDFGEMLRAIGFAQAVGVLAIFGIIPVLGPLVRIAVAIWMLACGVVAVRQALDFTTNKAVGTVLIGWLVYAALGILLGGLLP